MKTILIIALMLMGFIGQAQNVAILHSYNDTTRLDCVKNALQEHGLQTTLLFNVLYDEDEFDQLTEYAGLFIMTHNSINQDAAVFLVHEIILYGTPVYVESDVNGWWNIDAYLRTALGIGLAGNTYTPNDYLIGMNSFEGMTINAGRGGGLDLPIMITSPLGEYIFTVSNVENHYGVYVSSYPYKSISIGWSNTYYDDCYEDEMNGFFEKVAELLFDTPMDIPETFTQPHTVLSIDYYDMMGREIPKPTKGFYIERKVTDKGIISTKHYIQ